MTKILEKPIPPADGACCESGCSPCVWDFYYEERESMENTTGPASARR